MTSGKITFKLCLKLWVLPKVFRVLSGGVVCRNLICCGVQQANDYMLERNVDYLFELCNPRCLLEFHKSSTSAIKMFYYLHILARKEY